ncbi:MAG TPA: hypothetical protein VF331_18240 [Polyangiales bacterium]
MSLRQIRVILAALVATLMLAGAPAMVHAAGTTKAQQIPADFKGTIGVGLIGAELGFVLPALAGMDQTWAYIVFPAVGAIGGGALGYFALEKGNHSELSVASLMLGAVLLIPTMVLTLSETSYDPAEDTQSAALKQQRALALAKARRASELGTGMLRLSGEGVSVAAPGFGLVPGVSGRQTHISGLSLSLLSGRF